jgi:integrase
VARGAQPLQTLFADWWKEAEKTGTKQSTHDNYRNTVNKLGAFLKHDDAAKVTPEDVIRFKDHRLTEVSPKTVNDGDLAALKTIFGWGKTNRRLAINAAEGITIKLRKRPKRVRPNWFTDDEAKALLAAADAYQQKPREKTKLYWSKRWLPWLCCYTSARVGELIQLRKQDLRVEYGHHVIRITPEAGTQKVDHYRDVVLHPHLVEKGFVRWVEEARDGYLFIDPPKHGDVIKTLKSRRNDAAEFARETVKDPKVSPNHGWRHRFTTLWHEAGLSDRILHDIQGHADEEGGPVSRKYGETTVKAQATALAKFPRQGAAQPDGEHPAQADKGETDEQD